MYAKLFMIKLTENPNTQKLASKWKFNLRRDHFLSFLQIHRVRTLRTQSLAELFL